MHVHLTVIAKQPRAGFVKTRLCPPCTPGEAAQVAAAALDDTMDAVERTVAAMASHSQRAVQPVLLFDGDPSGWTRPGWDVVEQRGDGLAERLANAFDELGPGAIVGMETPHVVETITSALVAIDVCHDAIGLASDGGYWSIVLSRPDRRLFERIPMSTSSTGLAQLRRLHAAGRLVRRLPMARDLDDVADLIDAARRVDTAVRLRAAAGGALAAIDARRPAEAHRIVGGDGTDRSR